MIDPTAPVTVLVKVSTEQRFVALVLQRAGEEIATIGLSPEQADGIAGSLGDAIAVLAGARDPQPGEIACAICGKANVPGHVPFGTDLLGRTGWVCSRHSAWRIIRSGFTLGIEDTRGE